MAALPAERDAFGLLVDPVDAGLAHLDRCAPLWGDPQAWSELLVALGSFHSRWTASCRAAGWSDMQLFGVDPFAPRARLSRMGGAFLACLPGRRVIAIDDKAITMVTRTSARLRIYRAEQDAGAVLAWELCRP